MLPAKALSVGMVLFPGFQALDVFGPLDILNLLSRSEPINLSLLSETLEPVSTKPNPAPAFSNCEQSVIPTHTLDSAPPLDVLFIPGGPGTRPPTNTTAAVNFIQATYPTLNTLISVCTGAGLVARAGVLDGKNATTNKMAWAGTTALGPKTHWIAKARWVHDGNVWTTSGITAGIDGTLAWIADAYGEQKAQLLADALEHVRIVDSSEDPFAKLRNISDVPPQ